jgi:hypothetical protein
MRKLAFVAFAFLPAVALAHFAMDAPPTWMSQDSVGSPQKGPPCGDPALEGVGTATGIVTTYVEGQTVTITIRELITHPGHYRVSLATGDRSVLLNEPGVDAGNGFPCGYANLESPPVFPVLMDDVFDHLVAFPRLPDGGPTPQTVQVTLPLGVTCAHCTLQMLEFMGDHGINPIGGCFYHHCADITILPADSGYDAGPPPPTDAGGGGSDSGTPPGPDSGNPGGPGPDGGGHPGGTSTGSCGCTSGVGSASLAALVGLALLRLAASRRARQRT